MMRFVFMLAAVAICVVAQHEPPPAVGAAPQQPAPFSHRAHTALNLKCAECHPTAGPVPWARIYRLPDFVAFSHKRHLGKAQVACSACHGEVKSQDVLAKEKPIGMQSCMACHDKRKANNNCDACHAIHPA